MLRERAGAPVSPSAPVMITGPEISWYSKFNIDRDIVPGTGRWVKDNQTGLELYRIIFWRPGMYEGRSAGGDSVQAEIREGAYLFGKPQQPAAAATEKFRGGDWVPPGRMKAEPWFRTVLFEPVSDAFLMMVLTFPALRFY